MKQIITAYDLAYRFIPELIGIYNEGRAPREDLSNTHLWYSLLKDNDTDILLDWSCVSAEYHEVADDLSYVFYTFPAPTFCPEAKYAMAVLRTAGERQRATYYTLEYSAMHDSNGDIKYEGWVLGGMDGQCHSNYGQFEKEPTEKNFVDAVLVLQLSAPAPRESANDEDDTGTDVTGRKNIVYGLLAVALGGLLLLIFSSHLAFWLLIAYGVYLIVKGAVA